MHCMVITMQQFDPSYISYIAIYLVTVHISSINSRTSSHWRLNEEAGEVRPVVGSDADLSSRFAGEVLATDQELVDESDKIMNILSLPRKTLDRSLDDWILFVGPEEVSDSVKTDSFSSSNPSIDYSLCARKDDAQKPESDPSDENLDPVDLQSDAHQPKSVPSKRVQDEQSQQQKKQPQHHIRPTNQSKNGRASQAGSSAEGREVDKKYNSTLNCIPFVNITQYDHLRGIINRFSLQLHPEPEVAMIFRKKGAKGSAGEIKLAQLEARLSENKEKRPKSPQVFNQIGNFLRIRGDSKGAVECFRRALALSPNHPDVLLNLARVLFNHQFLEDAIYLTRRSLETQSPDRNSWLQHFTLGEILKAYGHYQEAVFHFRHALDLNPGFQPAETHLRDLEQAQSPTVTYYTLFIILFLVMGVLFGVLTSIEANLDAYGEVMKTQRHFNRAMAMKTLKLGINPKVVRMRRSAVGSTNGSSNGFGSGAPNTVGSSNGHATAAN